MVSQDQLEEWRAIQRDVAKNVEIEANDKYISRKSGDDELLPINKHLPSLYNAHMVERQRKLIGGVDISFGKGNAAVAVYVVVEENTVVYQDSLSFELSQPYVSSYLAFREIDPLEKLIARQKLNRPDITPEVIMVDGNGFLHERRAGIACFVGVRTGIPSIGVGKTVYCTDGFTTDIVENSIKQRMIHLAALMDDFPDFENCQHYDSQVIVNCQDPITPKSNSADAIDTLTVEDAVQIISKHCQAYCIPMQGENGDILGAALVCHGGRIRGRGGKSQVGTRNPIYVSIGHGISLQEALELCVSVSNAKIPEPVRQADLIGRQIIRDAK